MSITYDYLLEKQRILDKKHSERISDLIDGAQKLLEEYLESLVYTGDHKSKIAFIGELVSGTAEVVRLGEHHVDGDYKLRFTIFTDLTVSEFRKSVIGVPLTLSKSKGKVSVVVGAGDKAPLIIPEDNSAYSYQQVCLEIKNSLSEIIESQMPK